MSIDEGFGDIEAMFNSRDWLKAALKEKGAKIEGGGMGGGCIDVDISLEGYKYVVSMKPIL